MKLKHIMLGLYFIFSFIYEIVLLTMSERRIKFRDFFRILFYQQIIASLLVVIVCFEGR